MRPLPKQREVDILKVKERQAEIEQGVALARKIDQLRTLLSKEEANLTKFRDETVKEVLSQIKELIIKRDNLIQEIEKLKNGLDSNRQL
jgi:molecular chaperone DnaK (HSP70)